MKTYSKILLFVLLAITLFNCISCGKKVVDVDIDALISDVFAQSPFGEELVSRDLDDYSDIYGFKSVPERVAAYVGGGATADEIIVVKSSSEDDAKGIKESLEKYLTDQKESYADYRPNEVPKLNNAIIKQTGVYVIYCVSTKDLSGVINSHFE